MSQQRNIFYSLHFILSILLSIILKQLDSSQYSKSLMTEETYSDSWQRQECSISSKMSRLVLGPIQPPSQSVL